MVTPPPRPSARRLALGLLLAAAASAPAAGAGEADDLGAVRRILRKGDPSARAAAVRRLAALPHKAARGVLLERLDDPHPYVRRAAAGVLGTVAEEARAGLEKAIRRLASATARAEGCRAFALWADGRGRAGLVASSRDRAAAVRAAAVRWLGSEGGERVTAALRERLADGEGEVRALAVDALRGRADAGSLPAALHRDPDFRVRLSVLESSVVRTPHLHAGGGTAAVAVLRGLDDAVWSVRLLAAELARTVPDRRLLPALARALDDERARVARAAHGALVALTGIPFEAESARWQAWLAGDGADFDPAARPRRAFPDPAATAPPRERGRTVARPRFHGLEIVSRHVGFVLDASGSMKEPTEGGETRWARACRELETALRGLRGGRVNVFVFQDEVRAAFPEAAAPTPARLRTLRRWIAEVEPGGRTALYDGVAAALAESDLDTVVLLSDGAPSAGSFFTKTDVLLELERLNRWRRARIDVVAIGGNGVAARWRDVLERIAEASGGICLRR